MKSLDSDVRNFVLDVAHHCESYIKDNFSTESPSAPHEPPAVDTGYLKSSIVTSLKNTKTAILRVGAEYGIYLEYGTEKMQPRPFVLPAIEATARQIEKLDVVKEIVEE